MKTHTLEKPAHQFCKKQKKNFVNKSKQTKKNTSNIEIIQRIERDTMLIYNNHFILSLSASLCLALSSALSMCVVYAFMFAILVKLLITVHFDSSVVLPARISNNQYNHYKTDSLKYLSCALELLDLFLFVTK